MRLGGPPGRWPIGQLLSLSSPRLCWKRNGPRLPATPGLPSISTGIASRGGGFWRSSEEGRRTWAGRGGSLRAAELSIPFITSLAAEAFFAGELSASAFLETLGGEFPDQTFLELAIWYHSVEPIGRTAYPSRDWAPKVEGWEPDVQGLGAWLVPDPPMSLEPDGEPAFSFPFRPESLPVLEWAAGNSDDWVWDYLLALNLWAVNRWDETAEILKGLGTEHRFAPLFVARGLLLNWLEGSSPIPDLRLAVEADPGNRITHIHLIQWLQIEEPGRRPWRLWNKPENASTTTSTWTSFGRRHSSTWAVPWRPPRFSQALMSFPRKMQG